jgi:hypothetical protein
MFTVFYDLLNKFGELPFFSNSNPSPGPVGEKDDGNSPLLRSHFYAEGFSSRGNKKSVDIVKLLKPQPGIKNSLNETLEKAQ